MTLKEHIFHGLCIVTIKNDNSDSNNNKGYNQ